MNEENYTSIVVVKRDYTFLGTVSLDAAEQAAKQGARSIADLIEKTLAISPDTPLTGVINELAGWPYSLPVVDPASGELLGVVTRTGVLTVLAESTPNSLPAVPPRAAADPAAVASEVP